MASSSNLQRGFIPPKNEQEKLLVRRIEDLCRSAENRGIARYSAFLSDREQDLALSAVKRCGCDDFSFDGGFSDAERKLLRVEPAGAYCEPPISCIKISCDRHSSPAQHKDYLGALLGLGIDRSCLGDIILFENDAECGAYVFCLSRIQELICSQLFAAGRASVSACVHEGDLDLSVASHETQTATVAALRADAVIAAMVHCSRSKAVQLLSSGSVQINHIETASSHSPVYEGDVFTIRGVGRYKLTTLGGKSKKDRMFIEFFKY